MSPRSWGAVLRSDDSAKPAFSRKICIMLVRGDANGCLGLAVADIGEPCCEARDSTSSIVFVCHPFWTLIMA